jgi:hypothetical protein
MKPPAFVGGFLFSIEFMMVGAMLFEKIKKGLKKSLFCIDFLFVKPIFALEKNRRFFKSNSLSNKYISNVKRNRKSFTDHRSGC